MFSQDELNQLYRYALSVCAQEDIAYDLLQSALERYLKKSIVAEKPQAYLKIIMRNLYFDMQRHDKVVPMISIDSDELDHIEPVDSDSMDDLLVSQQAVEGIVSMLSSQENELLYLWAVEEYTVDEISLMYEKPRGTILSQLHRLKKRLREQRQFLFAAEDKKEGEI